MGERFCWSANNEGYVGSYETREAAEEDGRATVGAGRLWTARCVPLTTEGIVALAIDADDVLERLADAANSEVGEAAEDWPDVTRQAVDDLTTALRSIVASWLKANGAEPTFYGVDDVEECTQAAVKAAKEG